MSFFAGMSVSGRVFAPCGSAKTLRPCGLTGALRPCASPGALRLCGSIGRGLGPALSRGLQCFFRVVYRPVQRVVVRE